MWSFSCIFLAPSCKMLIARKWSTFLCKNVNAVLVSFVDLLNIFTSSESDNFVLQGPQKEEKPVVVPGRRKEHKVGKIHFVEHRTALHLYHSFHRLWIFFLCMLQVQPLSLQLNIEMLLETDVMCLLRIEDCCHCYSVLVACWMFRIFKYPWWLWVIHATQSLCHSWRVVPFFFFLPFKQIGG